MSKLLKFAECWLGLVILLSSSSRGESLPRATLASVGLENGSFSGIRPLMKAYVDRRELPGVITVVVRQGKVVHFECVGLRNISANSPMSPDTIFRLYSMTKPLISVATLCLYEQGHFKLDDPVSKYLPWFAELRVCEAPENDPTQCVPLKRPVTIRDLLRNTAGLPYGYGPNSPIEKLYFDAAILDRKGTLRDMVAKLRELPLAEQPGTRWRYGVSYDVLGHLIESVSGQSLDRFCWETLFRPLSMKNTSFALKTEHRLRLAEIYARDKQGNLLPWGGPTETSTFMAPVSFLSGGAGAISTVEDFLRFAQMLLNQGELDGVRILKHETVTLMTSNQLPGEFRPGWGYGFGVQVCTDVARTGAPGATGSYSWGGGGNTFFFVDPKNELIGMAWSQFSGATTLSKAFREAVYKEIPSSTSISNQSSQ